MKTRLLKPVALALLLGSAGLAQPIAAQSYLTGDFHQHTTYTDGSYTIGHMMSKNNQFGLQWWANSEHGGGFTTNARVTGTDTGNTVYWDSYVPNPIIGTVSMSGTHQKMWRWQMLRDSSFTEILKARLLYPAKTILQSYEMNVPGHEHGSMGLIDNQFLTAPNCSPIAQFEYMFDNSDTDITGGAAQNWTKSALSGHAKTIEALTWLKTNYPNTSYLVPAHPERKAQTNGGYTIAAFRDMNNAAPTVCFGFESMPGHQKDPGRGGYSATAVGGGTFGGAGYFSGIIGGLWDALLSEGRNFWLFANSDSHNEEGDFYPGEYQKNYTYTAGKSAQNIVDGLRSGNTWVVNGDLIDSLIYNVSTVDQANTKAVMGATLNTTKGKSVKITIKARDPQANNFNTYSDYKNPVLNHIDIIKGKVTGKIDPTSEKYNEQTVTTTSVIARFDAVGGVADTKNITSQKWKNLGNGWVEMSFIVKNVTDSVYFRLRGTNQGLNVANETDVDGNPLADALMGANDATKAFADLWFYSNPIFVYTTPALKTVKFQIKQASDDYEERIAAEAGQTQNNVVGSLDWDSSDLEFGCESNGTTSPQLIGLRFPGVNLPKNFVIAKAYIESEVDAINKKADPCNLTIWSEDNDNPVTFTNTPSVLTSRPKSTNSVVWNVATTDLNVIDKRYYSANIGSLVQANLNRAGWNAGNAMAFYIKGSGLREMESFEGENAAAAALVVEYPMSEQELKAMQVADSTAHDAMFGNHVTIKNVYTNFNSKHIGTFQNIDFREGGFSGLYSIPGTNGKEFYTMSDRGVNVDSKNATPYTPTYDKIFPFPSYAPKMHRIRVNGDSIQIIQTTSLRRPDGSTATGLVNPTDFGSKSTESIWSNLPTTSDFSSVTVNKDVWGIDCEGIAVSKNNEYWLCEEGGPTVWRLNSNGKVVNRYTPYANLAGAQSIDVQIDPVFKTRKNNRGFEGLAITPNGKVYSIIQSPMLNPNKTDGEKSYVHRILEINPVNNETKMYAYLNPGVVTDGTNTIAAKDWKIGDLSAINDSTFLVIEQGVAGTFAKRNIYKINITNATPITSALYNGKTVEQLKDLAGLTAEGIVPVQKTLFMDMKAAGWPDSLDKAEGLAIIDEATIAVCNDNDFGQISATENGIAEKTNIKSQLYVFNLTGDYKLTNFVPQSQLISNYADTVIVNAKSKVESDYAIPSYTGLKFAIVKASNVPDSTNIAKLEKTAKELRSNQMPYSINMAINGDTKTRMGFAWYNNAGVTGSKVEIVAGNSNDFSTPLLSVDATSTALNNVNYNVSGNNLTNLAGIAANSKRNYVSNKALVTGLTPNTTYSFRVGKTGAWSEVGTFTTAKDSKEPFSFVYTTDPQANAVDMFDISQKTTHAAHAMYPNANFWLSCGDLIETSGSTNSEWEYEQFFQTQQDIFMKKPTAYVIGNHDQSSNKNFTNHFNTSGPAFDATSTTPGSIYSYVYGDALFMAMSYEDYSSAGRLTDIANWMRAQVAANPDVKWRIVHYHKTIYTGSGSHQSDADGKACRDALAPVFDELKIDLALQGHDHIYEVMGPIKAKTLVANAVKNQISVTFDARTNVTAKQGGIFNVLNGTLYFLNNSAGRKKYEPRSQAQMAAVETGLGITNYFGMFSGRFAQTGNPTFSNITVSTDTIEVKTYEVSDLGVASPFDSFKVVKTTNFNTGVKNPSDKGQNAISIYPVPVKNYAKITFVEDVKARVDIYALNGSLIKSINIDGSSEVDLSNLSKGNYTLKVVSGTSNYAVKFIKE